MAELARATTLICSDTGHYASRSQKKVARHRLKLMRDRNRKTFASGDCGDLLLVLFEGVGMEESEGEAAIPVAPELVELLVDHGEVGSLEDADQLA